MLTAITLLVALAHAPCRADAPADEPPPVIELNPLLDTGLLVSGLTLGLTLELIISSSELTPQQPGDPDKLPAIDRPFARDDDRHDRGISSIALGGMGAYAIADAVLSDVHDRGDPWHHYIIMYTQSVALTLVVTDMVKIAVRRPRPEAYAAVRDTGMANEETNSALSFISGHASIAAALGGTATYMAFARPGADWERWGVLGGSVALTGVVGSFRVIEGKHFPTDVIAGAAVGAAIGLLVPHLHRPRAAAVVLVPTDSGLALAGRF